MPYLLLRGYEEVDETAAFPTVVIDADYLKILMEKLPQIEAMIALYPEFKTSLSEIRLWDFAPRWYNVYLGDFEWSNANDDPVIIEELPDEIKKTKSIRTDCQEIVFPAREPWEITWRAYYKDSRSSLYSQVLNLKEIDQITRVGKEKENGKA